MNFRFQYIEWFFLWGVLPILFFIFWYLLRWKKQKIKKIGDPALVQTLIASFSPVKFLWKFLLLCTALTFIIIALANPQQKSEGEKMNRKGVDMMIALDISKSMLAADIKPNRLERAKQLMYQLIQKSGDDRIGLVLFAGRAYIQMPLTTDHAAATMYIQAAHPDVVPTQGTVLSEALTMCNSAFPSKSNAYKTIVLISDGEDHDPDALSTAKNIAENGVIIHTIGIGSAEGSTIIDPLTNDFKKDREGNTVITRLNEDILRQIAQSANGQYQLLIQPGSTANNIRTALDKAAKNTTEDARKVQYKSFYQWLAGIALIFLLLELFLPETKKITAKITLLLLMFIVPFRSWSQKANPAILKGNILYQQQQFAAAQEQYQKALAIESNNAIAHYNSGNALYRNNHKEGALEAYDKAISTTKDKTLLHQALYNKGVLLAHQKKLPEAIAAFKESIQLKNEDIPTRENLQKAIEALKKQQEEKKKQEEKKPSKEQKPKEQQSKLSKERVAQLLDAMQQKEKALQKKLQSKNASPTQPEKDW